METFQSLFPHTREMARDIGIRDDEGIELLQRVMIGEGTTCTDIDFATLEVWSLMRPTFGDLPEKIEALGEIEKGIRKDIAALKETESSGDMSEYTNLRQQLRQVRECITQYREEKAALELSPSLEASFDRLLRLLGSYNDGLPRGGSRLRYARAAEDKAIALGYQRPRVEDVVDDLLKPTDSSTPPKYDNSCDDFVAEASLPESGEPLEYETVGPTEPNRLEIKTAGANPGARSVQLGSHVLADCSGDGAVFRTKSPKPPAIRPEDVTLKFHEVDEVLHLSCAHPLLEQYYVEFEKKGGADTLEAKLMHILLEMQGSMTTGEICRSLYPKKDSEKNYYESLRGTFRRLKTKLGPFGRVIPVLPIPPKKASERWVETLVHPMLARIINSKERQIEAEQQHAIRYDDEVQNESFWYTPDDEEDTDGALPRGEICPNDRC